MPGPHHLPHFRIKGHVTPVLRPGMRAPYLWPLGVMEAAQAGLYLCPSHEPFLYQLPEQEEQ